MLFPPTEGTKLASSQRLHLIFSPDWSPSRCLLLLLSSSGVKSTLWTSQSYHEEEPGSCHTVQAGGQTHRCFSEISSKSARCLCLLMCFISLSILLNFHLSQCPPLRIFGHTTHKYPCGRVYSSVFCSIKLMPWHRHGWVH